MNEASHIIESAAALYRQNQLQSAQQKLLAALQIDPNSIDAHLLLGIILVRTGRLKDAEAHLEAVLRQNPLGLIHCVFPNAKILHVRRSPLDTCLSIFTTQFGGGVPFAHDKRHIVDHYRSYLETMDHWRSVLPDNVYHEVDYEELVADKEAAVRRVLQHLELDWNDSCLSHSASGTIMTPSRWQARQPIYTSSVERWRRFEPWLGELVELRDVRH